MKEYQRCAYTGAIQATMLNIGVPLVDSLVSTYPLCLASIIDVILNISITIDTAQPIQSSIPALKGQGGWF